MVEEEKKELKIDVHDNNGVVLERSDNIWRSCCNLKSDKRLLVFSSNLTISLILLFFSIYKLNQELNCTDQNLYVGFISLITGYWIRSPLH